MRRDEALTRIRQHEHVLRQRGVVRVRLFGSVARDEALEASDVDVLIDIDPERQVSLFDVGGIQQDLVDMLGVRVDLSQEISMKEPVRRNALREAVLAF